MFGTLDLCSAHAAPWTYGQFPKTARNIGTPASLQGIVGAFQEPATELDESCKELLKLSSNSLSIQVSFKTILVWSHDIEELYKYKELQKESYKQLYRSFMRSFMRNLVQ